MAKREPQPPTCQRRRHGNAAGFFSSFQYVTLVGGHVLAQFTLFVILTTLSTEQVHEFGWRIDLPSAVSRQYRGLLAPAHHG